MPSSPLLAMPVRTLAPARAGAGTLCKQAKHGWEHPGEGCGDGAVKRWSGSEAGERFGCLPSPGSWAANRLSERVLLSVSSICLPVPLSVCVCVTLPSSCREHAAQLQRVAAEVKRCCQCLAAVLRSNAPVGPAIKQLTQLEQAFLELQHAVGAAGAHQAAADVSRRAAQQAAELAEQAVGALLAAEQGGNGLGAAAAAPAGGGGALGAGRSGAWGGSAPALAFADVARGGDVAPDSLALHLSLSMLFTCCTRVRGGRGGEWPLGACLPAWLATPGSRSGHCFSGLACRGIPARPPASPPGPACVTTTSLPA